MAKNFLALDMLPHWTGAESADDKCRDLLDYLYKMREGLGYVLNHLDERNFSQGSAITDTTQTGRELFKAIRLNGNTILIGGDGFTIEIAGTVKVNGKELIIPDESSDV